MNSAKLEKLYSKAPASVQDLLVSLEGWRLKRRRYGAGYSQIWSTVLERPFMPKEEIRELQRVRLQTFLRTASSSPFWRDRFATHGVSTVGADPFAELVKLPVLQKSTVRENTSVIRNPLVTGGLNACHTSGTTGSGLIFSETQEAEWERWAIWWRYRKSFSITQGTWCGYFGGRALVATSQTRPPYWRINRPGKQLLFSAYHLGPKTAQAYVDALNQHQVPWLHGYPSTLALLASFIVANKWRTPSVRVVTTGAENVLSSQREIIGKAFGCPAHQHYGQAEAVANISECENGNLHVDEDYAYVEFLPHEGNPGLYRIVGTNWSNPAFPLLRYDTGDLVKLQSGSCSCGRNGRLVSSIDGRQEDYVTLPSGAMIGRLDHIFKDFVEVREAQIYQPSLNQVLLRIVKGAGYTRQTEEHLLTAAREKLGATVNLSIEYCETLERTKSGKLRFVVSDLPRAALAAVSFNVN